MKRILFLLIFFSLVPIKSFSDSRFGELTEMRDKKMRGKDGQWVDLIQDLLFGTTLKVKKEILFFWEDVDQYVVY